MTQKPGRNGEPTPPWSCGSARFEPGLDVDGHSLIVAVSCRFGSLIGEVQALLDTGAQWSIVGGDMAEALKEDAEAEHDGDDEAQNVKYATRLGSFDGRLHRVSVTLVADEGEELLVQSTILVIPAWRGPPVLGYRGFLERIRIGLDPGGPIAGPRLFFGSDG